MIKRLFITGTDTKVGKTISSIALLQIANKIGFNSIGYKPVASGCKITKYGLRNDDALLLKINSQIKLNYNIINPYNFLDNTAPNIISKRIKKPISFYKMSSKLKYISRKTNWIIIEGAGGWFTPISKIKRISDWVLKENIPIILVVGIKLGCINHALLTVEVIKKTGLVLKGWIANNINIKTIWHNEYINTLKNNLCINFLGEIPYLNKNNKNELWKYINFSLL
ncbi:dethiobiotin synthase [Enterobacteriaceae bacterium ET-AT1-13]|nr:dethiobiotin synthase [Enterobacteriaceae bacterium ET-AT1-13]WGS66469.1 dethiobiotin synthase [Enterobacteriaceae bacterium Cmel17]WMC17494.1 MAG: dethiobiotin synthase [Enterobacteriaceae bacterium Cmel21]WMC17701.1 MAG: dethiobiotin synthase [Enterobacteriaceae bacterium PSmelAO3-2]WMC17905.1 MAG: dethiobiotin synthase [Enterobacteriaceae bacterium PSmelAO3-1]WMC18108.1 MAG: dethiobiotin synthase [Enterobacteriaceae bacterium PSmelAO1]